MGDLDGGASYYEGEFKLFLRSGHGTLENTETGDKYVGQFLADRCHGSGKHTWPDGSFYDGEWQSGRKHGQGVYVSPEQLKYEGAWHDGKRHGRGVQDYANGDTYNGWWYNGQCSGLGIYFFADGAQYHGAWNLGKYEPWKAIVFFLGGWVGCMECFTVALPVAGHSVGDFVPRGKAPSKEWAGGSHGASTAAQPDL
ncbi:unnamed protein product [Effrenium voratum]|uniref:Uncharacterized protein n=1 Tax=Effrenium voratum TaxID=2562239 RepID=A0AA36I684_9DINO|nr:unnamed protein product [Effrenium voratum]